MPVRIGELLLKEKRITPEQLQQALNHQKANGGKQDGPGGKIPDVDELTKRFAQLKR